MLWTGPAGVLACVLRVTDDSGFTALDTIEVQITPGHAQQWTETIPVGAYFGARTGHGVAVFKDRLWVIGGKGPGTGAVWSSADGKSWRQDAATAPFGNIRGHAVSVFQDRLWIFGGLH